MLARFPNLAKLPIYFLKLHNKGDLGGFFLLSNPKNPKNHSSDNQHRHIPSILISLYIRYPMKVTFCVFCNLQALRFNMAYLDFQLPLYNSILKFNKFFNKKSKVSIRYAFGGGSGGSGRGSVKGSWRASAASLRWFHSAIS